MILEREESRKHQQQLCTAHPPYLRDHRRVTGMREPQRATVESLPFYFHLSLICLQGLCVVCRCAFFPPHQQQNDSGGILSGSVRHRSTVFVKICFTFCLQSGQIVQSMNPAAVFKCQAVRDRNDPERSHLGLVGLMSRLPLNAKNAQTCWRHNLEKLGFLASEYLLRVSLNSVVLLHASLLHFTGNSSSTSSLT